MDMKLRLNALAAVAFCVAATFLKGCVFDTSGLNPPPVEPSGPSFSAWAVIERDLSSHYVSNPPPMVIRWACEPCGVQDLNQDLGITSEDAELAADALSNRFINEEIRSNHSSARVAARNVFFNGPQLPAPLAYSVTQSNINNLPVWGGVFGSEVVIPGSASAQNEILIDMNLNIGRQSRRVIGNTKVVDGRIILDYKRLYTSMDSNVPEERLIVTGMRLLGNDFDAFIDGKKLRVSNVALISYRPFEMIIAGTQGGIISGSTNWEFYQVQASPLFLSMDVEHLGPVRSYLGLSLPFHFKLDYTASPNAQAPAPFEAKMSFRPKDMQLKGEGEILVSLAGTWANRAPIADAGPNSVETCLGDGVAQVTLNASGSQDFDGQVSPLEFMWVKDYNVQGQEDLLSIQKSSTVTLPVGTHQLTLFVWDSQYAMGRDEKIVTVEAKPPGVNLQVKPANVKVSKTQFGKMISFDTTLLLTKYCHNLAQASIQICGDLAPRSSYDNDPTQDYDAEVNGIQFHQQKCGSVNLSASPVVPVQLKLRQRYDGPNNTFKYQIDVRVQDTGGAVGSASAFVLMTKGL